MTVLTAAGWRPLRRMPEDLREASRRLPGAGRRDVVALADQIFEQQLAAARSALTRP